MKTENKKRKKLSFSHFFEGFGSVLDISGPTPTEYLSLFEANPNKSIKANWNKVGDEIRKSMRKFDSEIISK